MDNYTQYQKDTKKFYRDPRIIAARKQYRIDTQNMPEQQAWAKFQTIITDVKTEITGLI